MKLKKIAIICSLCFVTPLSHSMSVFDGAVLGAVNGMNTAATNLLSQILHQLTQMTGEASTSASKIAESVSQSGDNTTQRAIDTQRELNSQNATRNTRMPIDPCANGARAIADPNFDRVQPGYRNGGLQPRFSGSGQMLSTGSVSLNKAIMIANGNLPAPSPETQALLAHEGACSVYAAGQRKASCDNAGTRVGAVTYPNADVRADTLMTGAQVQGAADKISETFSSEQIAAATAYMRNISNPIILRELTPAEAKSDEGRKYFSLRDAHAARLDLSTRPGLEWLNNKSKYKGTIPILQAMLDGQGAAAKYLVKQLPLAAPDWAKEGVSKHQLMTFEAARRYQNADWIKEIAQTSDLLTLTREQLMIAALDTDLATRQLMETKKTNIMLGAIYQASLNKDFMLEVLAQHRKATATR